MNFGPLMDDADLVMWDPMLLNVAQQVRDAEFRKRVGLLKLAGLDGIQVASKTGPGHDAIDTLLRVYFSFLRRKTDFFS